MHAYFFPSQFSNMSMEIFNPGAHEIWMRLTVFTMFILFGTYAQKIIVALRKAEEVAQLANTELSQIFDTSADGMRVVDKEFNVLRANKTFCTLVGLARDEIVGKKCYEVFKGPRCNTSKCPMIRIQAGEERLEQDEIKTCENNKEVPCIVTATPFRNHEGKLIGIVEDFKDISERKNTEEELRQSHERLRDLAQHQEMIREKERSRIAREIHDELGQTLTVLKMDIHWLARRFPENNVVIQEKIKTMTTHVDNTVHQVQKLCSELRPGVLDDLGLSAAIEWQANEFRDRMGITFDLTSEPEDITLEGTLSTAIFRIFQETLTNIARHSGATRVEIALTDNDDGVTLTVRDNGTGITEEQILSSKSLGLIGMRERVNSLTGTFSINGTENKGTVITINIPVQSRKDNDTNSSC